MHLRVLAGTLALLAAGPIGTSKLEAAARQDEPAPLDLRDLPASSAVSRVAARFDADRSSLRRFHRVGTAPRTRRRLDSFYAAWLRAMDALPEGAVRASEQEEWQALRERIEGLRRELAVEAAQDAATADLVPFAPIVETLALAQQDLEELDPRDAAGTVDRLARQVRERHAVLVGRDEASRPEADRLAAAATRVERLSAQLQRWHAFYDGYDPLFSWWLRVPQAEAMAALQEYADALKARSAGEASEGDGGPASDHEAAIPPSDEPTRAGDVPDLAALLAEEPGRMVAILEEYQRQLRGRGGRRGRAPRRSPEQRRELQQRWLEALEALDREALSRADRVDASLLVHTLRADLAARSEPRPGRPEVLDDSGIPGRPIGAEALSEALRREMIDYTPEELFEIGRREMAWCRAELRRASREMGLGDDWRAAVEKVKGMHVAPGEQPRLIDSLAWEAIDHLREHELLSVPPLAAETWGMQMMSPERQLVNPFFTGGPVISVSFPTDTMSHDAKLQSLRGNNVPFARATVHHELIPGHNLQLFMNARHATHRRPFASPFWLEGWALYWEMRLYERGFPATPEDRIGFLVWRSHRCARIVFSLGFHLGHMLPGECVDYLVENVGFDRKNAEAEVRRSFGGSYSPLYQAAYMLGGLQIRQLHHEQVRQGGRSEREFHDAVMQAGSMPIKMLRLLLGDGPIPQEPPAWRFYGELEPQQPAPPPDERRAGNPVLDGWYADPEGAVFGDRYWIFPTTSAPYDQQTSLDAFSSPDLVEWTRHPRVIDTTIVSWARRAMWAPCAVEKDGLYYLFFSANDLQRPGGPLWDPDDPRSHTGGIGVAVSDSPAGPYQDLLGRPLVGAFHNDAQPIDQCVFRDEDGTHYLLYGGWRRCNLAILEDDFRSLRAWPDGSTFRELTPEGYVEGPLMFRRQGKLYFLWSEGGWGNASYRVAYAMADGVLGPWRRLGTILQQDPAVATGAGHNSVLNPPGTDDWFIVYHRRPIPNEGRDHRVTCIDRLEFAEDGTILPVKMSFEGVAAHPLGGGR